MDFAFVEHVADGAVASYEQGDLRETAYFQLASLPFVLVLFDGACHWEIPSPFPVAEQASVAAVAAGASSAVELFAVVS